MSGVLIVYASTLRSMNRTHKTAAFLLVGLLFLIGCQPPREISLSDLKQCQESHCQELQKRLNSPMDWRIVVDTSGSYARQAEGREAITRDVIALLRQLPLRKGDTVGLDGFDAGYHLTRSLPNFSFCNFDSFAGGLNQPIEQCISRLLSFASSTSNSGRLPDHCFSDFQNTLAQISKMAPPRDGRSFYLFLTDGKNEPVHKPIRTQRGSARCGQENHVPLFSQSHLQFVNQLSKFNQETWVGGSIQSIMTRGLLFIITSSPASKNTIARDIADDWQVLKAARLTSSSLPSVIFRTPGDSYESLSETLADLTARGESFVFCLEEVISDRMSRCTGSLRLSPAEIKESSQPLTLPMLVLSSGHPELTVTTEVFSLYDGSPGLSSLLSIAAFEPGRWRLGNFTAPLLISSDRLNGARLPARLIIQLAHPEGAKSRAAIDVSTPATAELLWDFRKERATFPLFLASVLLCCGLICCYRYFRLVAISSVALAKGKISDPTPIHRSNFHGIRYRVDRRGEVKKVEWAPGTPDPAQCGPNCYFLDVSLLSSLPYVIVWPSGGEYPRLAKGEISYSGDRLFSILRPQSIWVPSLSSQVDAGSGVRSRFVTLSWGRKIEVEVKADSAERHEFSLQISRPLTSLLWSSLASISLISGTLFAILGVAGQLPDVSLSFGAFLRSRQAWGIVAVVFVLRSVVVVCGLLFGSRFTRIGEFLRFARSVAAHFFCAIFLGCLVASASGWSFGRAAVLSALFFLAVILISTYFRMTPRRRIERQRSLREDDFWLESTFWLWGRMNL